MTLPASQLISTLLQIVGNDLAATDLETPFAAAEPLAVPPYGQETALLTWQDGSAASISVTIDAPIAEQLVEVADRVQDEVVMRLFEHGLDPVWPRCPQHANHALTPRRGAISAEWVCPRTTAVVAAVGRLESEK